jgi:hypothetical protein
MEKKVKLQAKLQRASTFFPQVPLINDYLDENLSFAMLRQSTSGQIQLQKLLFRCGNKVTNAMEENVVLSIFVKTFFVQNRFDEA